MRLSALLTVLGLFFIGCDSGSGTGPDLGKDPLDGVHLEAKISNRVKDLRDNVIQVSEVVRWEFHDGWYRFTIQTEDPGVPLHYSVRSPRTVYIGNYWIEHRDRRLYTLHLERIGRESNVYSRTDGKRSNPPNNNIELPVLFGEETVTISETDYTYVEEDLQAHSH